MKAFAIIESAGLYVDVKVLRHSQIHGICSVLLMGRTVE